MRNQSKQKGFVSNLVPLVLKIHILVVTFAAQRAGREVHKAHPQAAAVPRTEPRRVEVEPIISCNDP